MLEGCTVRTFNSCTCRPAVCQCLVVQTLIEKVLKISKAHLMTQVRWNSKLRSVVRSSMHQCPGNWVAIGTVVMYYARAVQVFSAGIKCRHSISHSSLFYFFFRKAYDFFCHMRTKYHVVGFGSTLL